ncbi:efflux RND transporter periplasmic adaptor subunit [Candidatus Gottesmanbacteria bacterium]|nr:efflux RND transporter periplasmic adaptor subunit [Candidatus Gottesmanbacteria bacterium]
MKKVVISIIIIVGIIGFFWYRQSSQKTPNIETIQVQTKNLDETISASGKTSAKRMVDLKFQTSGLLIFVGVKEGDHVEKGQILASLDSREVQKNLEKTLIDYSKQRNDFEELWRVTYKGMKMPQDALTNTVARILEKNQWDLSRSVLDVELKALAIEWSKLVTPISGIVTHIDVPVSGVNITPAGAVFAVVDPQSIVFQANVDETDVGAVHEGMKAVVALDAYRDVPFEGEISTIAYASQTSSGGATIFPIEMKFASPSALRVGLNGDISIQTRRISNVLVAPREAVRGTTDRYVIRVVEKKYVKTSVTVGLITEKEIEIQSGLAPGDMVVIKGFSEILVH